MILTLKIKLNPTKEQKVFLLNTIKEVNKTCNTISSVVWEKKIFNQFKIHKLVYRDIKNTTNLSIQFKDTRSSKRLLQRLSGREKTHANIVNHTIAKSIVLTAKEQGKGIAIEDLTGIRFTSKRRSKKFKTKLGRWSFADLRAKLEYKALLNGVKLIVVRPHYTSQTCSSCKHIGKRTNKVFKCINKNCSTDTIDADFNACFNIGGIARAINHGERLNDMCCSTAHLFKSKTHSSLFSVCG